MKTHIWVERLNGKLGEQMSIMFMHNRLACSGRKELWLPSSIMRFLYCQAVTTPQHYIYLFSCANNTKKHKAIHSDYSWHSINVTRIDATLSDNSCPCFSVLCGFKKPAQTKYYTNTTRNSVAVVLIASIISKIFERFFLETRPISPQQHSFLPSRPCVSNVLAFEEAVTSMVVKFTLLMSSTLILPRPMTHSTTDFFWRKGSP